MTTPLVAIVGRPNVGKSTLFNRLIRRRLAIVENVPGVTRDRHYADTEWAGRTFTVIDTGGFLLDESENLQREVREQAQAAVEECDAILFVVDGQTGATGPDADLAQYLRKSGKPTLVIVNKVDDLRAHAGYASEFYRFGLKDLFEVSAEHGRGVEDMVDRLLAVLPPPPDEEPVAGEGDDGRIRVAIVGRPNVGKSTLVNALVGKPRNVVSSVAGTTRDPIDSELDHKDRRFVLTDTAGIRRKSTIAQRVEQFAVMSSLRVIDKSDVAVLLMDATEPAVDQDARIAGIAEEKGRALLIVVNKWDKVKKSPKKEEELREEIKLQLKFVAYAPMIFTSALTGSKIEKVLDLAGTLYDQYNYRARTPQLNKMLAHITTEHPLPFAHGKALRIYYVAQVTTAPPTFQFTCNMPKEIPDRYKRYLVNQIRKTFDLRVPIRLMFKERPGQKKRAEKVQQMKARAKHRR